MLTTNQKTQTQSVVNADINTNWTHVAVGTGTTAPAVSDTALGTEVWRAVRKEISTVGDKVTVSAWIPSTDANGSALTEVGAFNASSGGTMWSRDTFTAINKTSSIEVWIDLEVTNTVTIN